jgi:hypothetical protein
MEIVSIKPGVMVYTCNLLEAVMGGSWWAKSVRPYLLLAEKDGGEAQVLEQVQGIEFKPQYW